ncbi:hypothetical protein LCM23_20010 [Cytobacillus kochii]|uniref:hypothetical protein n=1 Tax=Cytobacillus kochii TaxID=859143 RepID=UPI001CD5599E|nr:hypothetical protein [Cytobacillus kochii]MCA1028353.1 hypothetical protein [Cytobacillus kochii]
MNIERIEHILSVIDKLGVVSIKQLHEILKLGSYRNTCKVIHGLGEYLHVTRSTQKIVYLNKDGRDLIGSDKEIKKSILFDHMLLCNHAYIYYGCPFDWKREYPIETTKEQGYNFGIQIKGLTVVNKEVIIPDAGFTRNGYVNLVEIDNIRKMQDNRKKIMKYIEMWSEIQNHFNLMPKLCFFTCSDKRKKEITKLCASIPSEVKTFNEVK